MQSNTKGKQWNKSKDNNHFRRGSKNTSFSIQTVQLSHDMLTEIKSDIVFFLGLLMLDQERVIQSLIWGWITVAEMSDQESNHGQNYSTEFFNPRNGSFFCFFGSLSLANKNKNTHIPLCYHLLALLCCHCSCRLFSFLRKVFWHSES